MTCRESRELPPPENALARAYELLRRLLPYKYRYNLQSPEEALEFLEKAAAEGNRKAAIAEERLRDILSDPTTIFYETIGTDLTAPEYYEDLKKEGYKGSFLDFTSEFISKYLEEHGIKLKDRDDLSAP